MNNETQLLKYPRTRHLQGSKLQPGDEDLSQVHFLDIANRYIVVEEKCDGANSAISFSKNGDLLLQSRGHYLSGGYRERHYDLLKQWANVHKDVFYSVLGSRYIMYGEWMYGKHSIFYDKLPHYFLEFDIYDRKIMKFLDTKSRRELLKDLPVVSVPVLKDGTFSNIKDLLKLIGNSNYISENHLKCLKDICMQNNLDADKVCKETDNSILMEGLYIKVEQDGYVIDRLKYVRSAFIQCILSSETHWIERPIIPNQLGISFESLFYPTLKNY